MSTVQAILSYLVQELPRLLESGENWQLTLHGNRGGEIDVEVKQTRKLLRPPKPPNAQ